MMADRRKPFGRCRVQFQAVVSAPVPKIPSARRPRVSVVVPSYNYERFLRAAVGSALSQEGVEPEVIIVDDCSTDQSADLADRLADSNPRVTAIRHPRNVGHVMAFNTGYAAATGEFIVRLDADDLLTPGSLARSVALFDAFPDVGLVYGHPAHFKAHVPPEACTTDRGWSVWSGEDWLRERCRTAVNCITTPEAMIRSSIMRSIGPLRTELRFAQDMEMWLRTAAVSDVGRIDGPDQAFHRDHAASMSATDGAGKLVDLTERRTVFDLLFADVSGKLSQADELRQAARFALADEALIEACRAYDRGRTAEVKVRDFIEFAIATYSDVRQLPHWRALQRRQRIGARLAPMPPLFTATIVNRWLRWKLEYRRWQRTGL